MKIGEYIRTEYGIAKIISISCGEDLLFDNDNIFDEDEKEIFKYNKPSMYSNWANNNIIKSSPNIIDLIEVGDCVNGLRIDSITEKSDICEERVLYHEHDNDFYGIYANEIKSIVTKEMYSSVEYRVENN